MEHRTSTPLAEGEPRLFDRTVPELPHRSSARRSDPSEDVKSRSGSTERCSELLSRSQTCRRGDWWLGEELLPTSGVSICPIRESETREAVE